jgi:hypothetical protein
MYENVDWIRLAKGPLARSCERGDELRVPFLAYQLVKDHAPRSHFS